MIAIACDHGGINLKKEVQGYLDSEGIAYKDFGTFSADSCDYADFAFPACESVARGESNLGILICGTGIGMSIAANKVKGIRAAVCGDVFSARMTRAHNDANVLCMGERVVGTGLALEILKAFLSEEFQGGRHAVRIGKIADYENKR